MEQFFFSKFEITQWNGVITKKLNKEGCLNQRVISVDTACVCIVFFFHYFKNQGQNIFLRITVSYLKANVERNEETPSSI